MRKSNKILKSLQIFLFYLLKFINSWSKFFSHSVHLNSVLFFRLYGISPCSSNSVETLQNNEGEKTNRWIKNAPTRRVKCVEMSAQCQSRLLSRMIDRITLSLRIFFSFFFFCLICFNNKYSRCKWIVFKNKSVTCLRSLYLASRFHPLCTQPVF